MNTLKPLLIKSCYRRLIPTFLLLTYLNSLSAQHQFFYKDILQKEVGFEASPTCMVEDSDGFFWIGTNKGLYRFDGSRAREVKFAPNDSLIDDSRRINNIAIDHLNSTLRLATGSGVFEYAWRRGVAKHLPIKLYSDDPFTFRDDPNDRIFIDRQGQIWTILERIGLTHLMAGGLNSAFYLGVKTPLPKERTSPYYIFNSQLLYIAQDNQNQSLLWIGTRQGLSCFDKSTDSIRHYYYSKPDKKFEARTNTIQYILPHSDGKLYLGTANGLLIFDYISGQFSHHLRHPEGSVENDKRNNIYFLAPYSATQIWVSQGEEVSIFDTKTGKFTKVEQPAGINYIDRAGNFWGFEAGGLALYHHSKNQIKRLLFPDEPQYKATKIWQIREDTTTQSIYIRAPELQGIPVFDRRTLAWTMIPLESDTVLSPYGVVLEKNARGILVDHNLQFFLMPPGTHKFKPFPLKISEPLVLGGWNWLVAHTIADGSLVISDTRGYLYWLKNNATDLQTYFKTNIDEPYHGHFNNPIIRGLDGQGRVWMTCQGGFSIFIPNEGRFLHVPVLKNPGAHFDKYYQFTLDQAGRMWCLGQHDIGWIDPRFPELGVQQRFGQANGFAIKMLDGKFDIDQKGMLWFISEENLAKFDTKTLKLTLFEGWGKEFPAVLEGGEVAFRNAQGIGLMHPDSLHANAEQPRPYITGFKVLETDQHLSCDLFSPSHMRLKPDENFFNITFSALGFFNAPKFRFAYKLEGFDEDWIYPEAGVRLATYAGLPGGDYIFRLKVANSLGVWNEAALQWRISVGTPWWASWWFRILLASIILAAALFFWLRMRFQQQQIILENQQLLLEKEQTLREERDRIASEMHDDLGAGLSTIRMLSLAAKRHESDPTKSARIDKIAQSAADVMEKMADIIWVMNSRNDSLENFIAYLRRYAGEYLETHEISLQFLAPDLIPAVSLSGEQRRNLLLAVKECLHNVVKHANATAVRLEFTINGYVRITIADNGVGIQESLLSVSSKPDNNLKSNGLNNLHFRMAAMGGSVTVENIQGVSVTLQTGVMSDE